MQQIQDNRHGANQFLKGTLILTAAGIIVKVIGSLNWIILSRVLGGEGIGLYQMAFPIYLLALSLSTAGIPTAISIITAEKVALRDYRGANRIFQLSLILLVAMGLGFSMLMYFGAGWLVELRFIRDARAYYALLALSPAIFLVTVLSSFRGYLQGWQIMTPTAVSQIVEQLFRVATMLIFAALLLPKGIDYAAGGASLGAGAGAAAGLAVLLYYYWRLQRDVAAQARLLPSSFPQENAKSIMRRIIVLALPVSISSIMLPLVANLDLFIVPARLEAAGYTVEQATELFGYLTGMAVPLVNLATLFTAALATSLVPAVAEACALGNGEQIIQRTAAAIRLTNIVTIPAAAVLWLLATPISTFVYHAPQAGEVVSVLAVSVYLLGLHQTTTGVLQGLGHTAIPVVNMGISAVVKVVLNWRLVALPALGIKGAAWATAADMGVAAFLNLYFVYRYTGFRMDLRALGINIFAAAVMSAGIYVFYDAASKILTETQTTLATMLLAAIVYVVVLLLMGGLSERDIMQIPLVGAAAVRILSGLGLLKP
ncbi:polysaccharide biosynthesis protein [Thermosinus carboxydivorans Nor1]|uniref:Polysaccharide biosynthesis protein n=1 Tax=Thermosinus carboxydivorans Nor1 TaxID=401526 RepID=A1HLQ5_9FIRM|nr:polysaccharide biosynthesis protein [Thermosinus carboxydivorans]EAX48762.1 polysaccharide biosynthesis protein [Thermosinus carboxydivorans Nor1]